MDPCVVTLPGECDAKSAVVVKSQGLDAKRIHNALEYLVPPSCLPTQKQSLRKARGTLSTVAGLNSFPITPFVFPDYNPWKFPARDAEK
eukprot:234588-Amphidinium_carterae.2